MSSTSLYPTAATRQRQSMWNSLHNSCPSFHWLLDVNFGICLPTSFWAMTMQLGALWHVLGWSIVSCGKKRINFAESLTVDGSLSEPCIWEK